MNGITESMNLCIVTVYNSINSGSFLQAFSLAQALMKMGHNVSFYERTGSQGCSNSLRKQVKRGLKLLLGNGLATAGRYCRSVRNFKKDLGYLKIIERGSEKLKGIDCFILGSDTIWNFADEYFFNNYEIYLGKRFFPGKIITYAASLADSTDTDYSKIPDLREIVSGWSAIGVRDENTKLLMEKVADINVNIVCDPVFLLSKNDYGLWIKDISEKKYIFLYLFEKLSDVQISELKFFANEKDLRIINGASPEKPEFCDEVIINSPFIFLSYIFHAAYVVTDTFHGTAFSIHFDKNFCVIDRGKKKVEDLLIRMNFTDRVVRKDGDIVPVIDSKLADRRDVIEKFRKSSLEYLKKALETEDAAI